MGTHKYRKTKHNTGEHTMDVEIEIKVSNTVVARLRESQVDDVPAFLRKCQDSIMNLAPVSTQSLDQRNVSDAHTLLARFAGRSADEVSKLFDFQNDAIIVHGISQGTRAEKQKRATLLIAYAAKRGLQKDTVDAQLYQRSMELSGVEFERLDVVLPPMVRDNLIRREADSNDGRAKGIMILPKGEAEAKRMLNELAGTPA